MGGNKVILIALTICICKCCCEDYILKINQGQINGSVKYNRKGGLFYSYQSIPFAKPPIGQLRFKEPQEADNWNGILDATEDLPHCYQLNESGDTIGQEDCLYLNVYTPKEPSNVYDTLIDVMVFIYGGGFRENAGREDLYSPEFLLTKGIVLVTINYRLGIFGSFNLEDSTLGYPGNLHMRDQTFALKWVQANIERFGGNPESVTIFGESAGGVSVHNLVLSPLSAGTFHKAILESGTALGPWAVGVQNNGILLAEAINISIDDVSEMINELLDKDGDEIFRGQQILTNELYLRWGGIGYPVLEAESQSAFQTEPPLSLIQSGNYNSVPMIIGYNNAEGIGYINRFSNLYNLIPGDLNVEENSEKAEQIIEEMKNFYFNGDEVPTEDAKVIIQMYTDVWFAYPAYRSAREHQKTSNNSIYFYRFSADTSLNVYKLRNNLTARYEGATHADDLGYLFKTHYHDNITGEIQVGSIEYLAIDRIVTLWTNFAKHGDPTPNASTESNWLPVTEEAFNYVDFGSIDTMPSVDPDPKNIKFWADIYEKYSG